MEAIQEVNSAERHEKRYQRRKVEREKRKTMRNTGYNFDNVYNFNALRKAFYVARKGVNWKASVQNYGINVIENSIDLSDKLYVGKNISKGFVEFYLYERGKKRHIKSVHISERVVQKSLCINGITPVISKSLIRDNAASQKDKGTDFSRRELREDLHEFYRRYDNNGYVLLGDSHAYFDSIDHKTVCENLHKWISNQKLIELTMKFINAFDHGLGLGSEVCQILAVSFLNHVDHIIKDELRCKWYGRYNDDFYILCSTKEEAQRYLLRIQREYAQIKLELNDNKTQIVKLSHGFKWLQDRMYLTCTGKVIDKPGKKSISRNRKKLKKISSKLYNGELSYPDIVTFYASITGSLKHKNAYYVRENMDILYNQLIIRRFKDEVHFT